MNTTENWLVALNPRVRYLESRTHDVCCFSAHSPRGKEGWGDTNYCVLDAVAAAFNIVWAESNRLLTSLGRKKKRGYSTARLLASKAIQAYGEAREAVWFYREVQKEEGTWRSRSVRPAMTIATFLRKCDPSRRYVVTVSGHALAVIGGKVRGENNLGRRVKRIWEVTPHLQRPGAINLPVLVKKNLTPAEPCARM